MAEAHRATVIIIPEDKNKPFSFNRQTVQFISKSFLRYWTSRYYRVKNNFLNGLYPARPKQSIVIIGGVLTASAFGYDPSFGIIMKLQEVLQSKFGMESPRDYLVASFCFSVGVWVCVSSLRKWLLYRLLCYHGWMYNDFGSISIATRIWSILLKIISTHSLPQLYSFQRCLPFLPVPKLRDTINKYLLSMRPLMDDKEFFELSKLANEFRRKHGLKIQFCLYLTYLFSNNYVSDWWERFVYLSSRSPLIINSNYYGMDSIFYKMNWVQSARAANIVHAAINCMQMIRKEQFQPLMLQGIVPLCSKQYERIFCTTRIPSHIGENDMDGRDCLVHLNDSHHIVVLSRGRIYKFPFRTRYHFLDAVEIEQMIIQILEDKSEPEEDEKMLPVLTAGKRNHWAYARHNFFSSGINKKSLEVIESAAFVLVLEDFEVHFDSSNGNELDKWAASLMHGKGYDRWFDKSFNIIVFKNGAAGLNVEHSWADAPIMGHLWEYIVLEDSLSPAYGYGPDGHCRGIPSQHLPKPERLQWQIKPELSSSIQLSYNLVKTLIDDLDIHILVHSAFGKGAMKHAKVSPDGFIQLALQLAFYRMMHTFCQTYEASMTRLFREGRTETVRSCTNESCKFVQAMLDPNSKKPEKIELLKKATTKHQALYRAAMTGGGVDRHLFCMYVMCKIIRIESPFLQRALSYPWRLSTSQTPQGLTKKYDLRRFPYFISAGGGFGPVADDGYGISYIIAGEDRIFFHISSKFSCKETDSKKFSEYIVESMKDLKDLFNQQ